MRLALASFVIMLALLAYAPGAMAQNENETVGFRPNHAFESGQFGENIDTLNGGLNLTTPIGQVYRLNPRLAYQLSLAYNSKIWSTDDVNNAQVSDSHRQVYPRQEGSLGVGFTLTFGRIFSDPQSTTDPTRQSPNDHGYTVGWYWVSLDGTQHEFYDDSAAPRPNDGTVTNRTPIPVFHGRSTNDLSFTRISGPGHEYCPPWVADIAIECFKVETPDGLRYSLEQRNPCINPGAASSAGYQLNRGNNASFCGWYTTLIEDRSVGSVGSDGLYPHHVVIAYDDRVNFKHALSSVTDSDGRVIQFHTCEWGGGHCSSSTQLACNTDDHCPASETCQAGQVPGDSVSLCVQDRRAPITTDASDPSAVATYAIDLPGFGNDSTALSSHVATYGFRYEYRKAVVADYRWESCTDSPLCDSTTDRLMSNPLLRLVRMDYPPYNTPDGADLYSLYFGYENLEYDGGNGTPACGAYTAGGDYAEISCRTLPLLRKHGWETDPEITGNACDSVSVGPKFEYTWAYYVYVAAYLSGGHSSNKNCNGEGQPGTCSPGIGQRAATGESRQLTYKQVQTVDGEAQGTWSYCRPLTSKTNPESVAVTDPDGNVTVYRYHASMMNEGTTPDGTAPEDGYAPEWDDGLLFETDYYEGDQASGRLVRVTTQDYDSDRGQYPPVATERSKDNTRVQIERTQYVDDGGREAVTTRNNWDLHGHWLLETQSGFDVTTSRRTRHEYLDLASLQTRTGNPERLYLPGLMTVEEINDGFTVLSRTDNDYELDTGRLHSSVNRAALPPIGTAQSQTQYAGDVKTSYTYSLASGNVIQKSMTAGPSDTGYTMVYGYGPALGRCLAALSGGETAANCGGYLASKAFLDSGVQRWKSIDRQRDANTGLIFKNTDPAGVWTTYAYDDIARVTLVTPEFEYPTQVSYTSLKETWVAQLDPGEWTGVSTTYRYDGFGRVISTEKVPDAGSNTGVACQTAQYDVFGNMTFQSEWRFHAGPCAVGDAGEKGTRYSRQATDSAGSPLDPFGRNRRVIPADADSVTGDKVTSTRYFGTSSEVTIHGVMAPNAVPFPATTTFYKDGFGRLSYVDEPSGQRCSVSGHPCSTSSNCGGTEACVSTDGGADASYQYDALDRLTDVDLIQGTGPSQSRHLGYDGLGHLLWLEQPENGATIYEAYDALGNPLRIRDAQGNLQTFTYDFAGRPLDHRITPAGGSVRYLAQHFYDDASTGRGRSAGKVTTIKNWNDAGMAGYLTEDRYYGDQDGRLAKISHRFPDGPVPLETNYSYNGRGQISRIVFPADSPSTHTPLTVDYGYSNGFVTTATEVGLGRTLGTVTYNAAGAVRTVTTPGGGTTTIAFDDRNRPLSLLIQQITWTHIFQGPPIAVVRSPDDFDSGYYRYDGAGNIYRRDSRTGGDPLGSYGYDAANRLVTSVSRQNQDVYQEGFVYDAFGNITQRSLSTVVGGTTETDTFSLAGGSVANNRISSEIITSGQGGGTSGNAVGFDYDANGNLLETGRSWFAGIVLLSDIKRNTFDDLNRMTKVSQKLNPAAPVPTLTEMARFGYDGAGNRIWKIAGENGTRTLYVRDPSGQVLSEFRKPSTQIQNVMPEWTKDYVYLAGQMIAMKENLKPQAPTGVHASEAPSGSGWVISLGWQPNSEEDVTQYRVLRKRNGIDTDFVEVGTPDWNGFDDGTVHAANQAVAYKVEAIDSAGYASEDSATLTFKAGDNVAPFTPSLSSVVAGDRQVVLRWNQSIDFSGIAGYQVVRRTSLQDNSVSLTTSLITALTFVDTALTNGVTYYYRIRAIDNAGNGSAYSCAIPGGVCDRSAVPKDFSPPVPPTGLMVCGAANPADSISLSWNSNPDSDGSVSYKVFRNTVPVFDGSSPAPTLVGTVSQPFFTDAGVPIGTQYYAIKAIDTNSPPNESAWSEIRATVGKSPTVTARVTIYGKGGDGLVSLQWTPDLDSGGTDFSLYRRPSGQNSCFEKIAEAGVAGLLQDGSVENNIAYEYAMTSKTAGVESGFSNIALGIPLSRPSRMFECRGPQAANHSASEPSATIIQWPSASDRVYQTLQSTANSGPLGLLKGYHVLVHTVGDILVPPPDCTPTPCSTVFRDDSPISRVLPEVGDTSDPFLISTPTFAVTPTNYGLSYPLGLLTATSPTIAAPNSMFVGHDHLQSINCAMPVAVYKVYAQGTWLTVESGYPDYFDNSNSHSDERCGRPLHYYFEPAFPLCPATDIGIGIVPPPTNFTADQLPNGGVRLHWAPPANPSLIAGYHVYGATHSTTTIQDRAVRRNVPIATLAPSELGYDVSGLSRFDSNDSVYGFQILAFGPDGRNSQVVNATWLHNPPEPGTEAGMPGAPRSVHTTIWTINDATENSIRSRNGIKLSWAASPTGSGQTLAGFRVYRSTVSGGIPCALLRSGTPTPPLPDEVTVCATSAAASANLTVSGTTGFFWDRSVTPGQIYFYRVAQLESGTSGTTESSLANADEVAGRQPVYDPGVLPPVQGLQAWAPEDGTADMGGIALRWCPIPQTNSDDPLTISEYRIYRHNLGTVQLFELLARIDPACVAGGGDTPSRRCVIDSTNACVQTSGLPRSPCNLISASDQCGGSGQPPCRILDRQFNYWPYVTESQGEQEDNNFEYRVTAVTLSGATVVAESPQAPGNEGWLNYCDWPGVNCHPRRDPEGKPEYFICGDENVKNATPPPADPSVESPYRLIGDIPCPDCGEGTNPYSPPSRMMFYHMDHLGTPRIIYDGNAMVLEKHDPLPFGDEVPVPAATTTNTRVFTGHERDSETGLDYMMARYYSSSLGRFMAVDPAADSATAENPQTWNRYAYANNNPIILVDNDGESATVAGALIGGAVAGGMALAQGKSWREVGSAAAGGAVAGAIIGSVIDTGGASLGAIAAAGALGGASGVLTTNMLNGQMSTPGEVASGAIAGTTAVLAGVAVGAAVEGAIAGSVPGAAAEPAKVDGPSTRSPLGKGLDASKYETSTTTEAASGRAYKGGTSSRTEYTPKGGSEPTLQKHTIVKDGQVVHQHFKPPEK
jgi:RHS repeat-associated protein